MGVWLAIVVIYCVALVCLSLYGLNHAALTIMFWARRPRARAPLPPLRDAVVTIQLPLFNEFYVAERVIRSACEVDYPLHLLEIQVLDDSTDETLDLTRRLVREYQAAGVPIVHLHREDRRGFKGGALRYGFERARGEFLAVFDADFIVPPDFLKNTLPHFADPSVGIVQTRWAYFNDTCSELTRATRLPLDGHFVVEQAARCWSGLYLNFNGTAGILRRQAISEAGGWQDDTITEDIDLSYRAQLAGWRAVYLPDVACLSEIPADIHSLKAQQFRWTKGALETARKILPRLWRAPVRTAIKVEGSLHLLSSMGYPLLLVLMLLTPFVMMAGAEHGLQLLWPIGIYANIGFLGTFCCYWTSARAVGGQWRRRLLRYPLFLSLSIGGSLNNARAALEGLMGKRSPFERTPKYRVTSHTGTRIGGRYRSRASWIILGECLLFAWSVWTFYVAVSLRQYGALPFLFLFVAGYGVIALYGVTHMRFAAQRLRSVDNTLVEVVPAASAASAATAA
jgi:cellulose synthase/poly-beta-1,6-N-acetylglucosamine synthase-like glycosyltransferase